MYEEKDEDELNERLKIMADELTVITRGIASRWGQTQKLLNDETERRGEQDAVRRFGPRGFHRIPRMGVVSTS